MSKYTDNFESFADFQKQAFEPARKFNSVALEVFESFARKNYALLGDVVNYTVEQAKLPTEVEGINELFERQVSSAREFTERLTERANEYAEIAKSFQSSAQKVINDDYVQPVRTATRKSSKKAA